VPACTLKTVRTGVHNVILCYDIVSNSDNAGSYGVRGFMDKWIEEALVVYLICCPKIYQDGMGEA
jgi:hypothetical protein